MPKDACAVANYLITQAGRRQEQLTPIKLLTLAYFAHGWHLAWHDRPLFGDDVEARPQGPVIVSIYDAFSKYGREPITRPSYGKYDLFIDLGVLETTDVVIRPKPISAPFSTEERQAMDEVYRTHRNYSEQQLMRMSRWDGSPWKQTYKPGKNVIIENDVIEAYYKDLARQNDDFHERALGRAI